MTKTMNITSQEQQIQNLAYDLLTAGRIANLFNKFLTDDYDIGEDEYIMSHRFDDFGSDGYTKEISELLPEFEYWKNVCKDEQVDFELLNHLHRQFEHVVELMKGLSFYEESAKLIHENPDDNYCVYRELYYQYIA